MKFSDSHEWIKVTNDVGMVGISDHAQHELGDIVFIELPKVGKTVKAGEEIAVLESTKAAADVYSPVSGEVVEVNTLLQKSPELVNKNPEDEGWIYKIRISNLKEMDQLLDPEDYKIRLLGRQK